jgi:hypothetical protein
MVGDQTVDGEPDVMPVARPAVIRRRDKVIAHRREFDHAAREQEETLALDDGRSVAPFPQRAAPRVTPVEVRDVTPADRLHRLGKARFVGG